MSLKPLAFDRKIAKNSQMHSSIWNQNQIHGMLIVFPVADCSKTLLKRAPRRIDATIVSPTREKMPASASFLCVEMRTPQRIQMGNAMTVHGN